MRLELSKIVPVHHSIFLDSLKDYYSSSAITNREKLSLLIECNSRQNVLLRDVRRIRLSKRIQGLEVQRLHLMRWQHL